LEIPELEAQLQKMMRRFGNAANQVSRAQHELSRYQAQYKALDLQYTRLNGVFQSQPGIVAQQEVDGRARKGLGCGLAGRRGPGGSEAVQSQMAAAKAKLVRGPEPL